MKDFFRATLVCAAMCAPFTAFAEPTAPKDTTTMTTKDPSEICAGGCGLPASDAELRKLLTPEQYHVMKENGTERPFSNAYHANKADGIYVDRISGVPLFSSKTKFDSGTGWPSFYAPISPKVVKEVVDREYGMVRTEVRATKSDSHLGHVFDDGPAPTGLRYCMNSASLRFIPVADLEKEGLGQFLPEFGKQPTGAASAQVEKREVAIFAAGCFWGVEETFRATPGVKATSVGYTGGHLENPTYKAVCSDTTGHAEAVRVEYDPAVVSYDKLLEIFWTSHDPTQVNRQGPDIGTQYRSSVFFTSPEQEKAAIASKKKLSESGKFRRPIATEIVPATTYYPAEDYHQQYLAKRGLSNCHL